MRRAEGFPLSLAALELQLSGGVIGVAIRHPNL